MDRMEAFISRLFAAYPPNEDVLAAKTQLTEQLAARLAALEDEGLSPEEAQTRALIEFGAAEGAQAAILQARTRRSYRAFRRRYPWMVKGGILALVAVPPAAALLLRSADQKAEVLAAWTLAVIAGVAFVIAVEYVDYRYQKAQREHRTTLERLVERGDWR